MLLSIPSYIRTSVIEKKNPTVWSMVEAVAGGGRSAGGADASVEVTNDVSQKERMQRPRRSLALNYWASLSFVKLYLAPF